jgi:hypothetical protein
MTASVRVVGVRHHSPACARLVKSVIDQVRPGLVLVEGPADFNPRIQELLLPHKLPVAIYSYFQHALGTSSSWTPFCEYSPEWVALREGQRVGAKVQFMDLPVWTRPFRGVENRYADRPPGLGYVEELCRRLNTEGSDCLWDHLFEQPLEAWELEQRLASYFHAMRESEPASESDLEREEFMARHLAWAAREELSVVAVCGGFHKPQLEALWPQAIAELPEVPRPQEESRHGSFLVPYSYHRLDSFAGYASGMPSPYYYGCLWHHGPERASQMLTEDVVKRLRKKKQMVSAADLINAKVVTEGLMRLRGHEAPLRSDLLDGFAGALVKDALEMPLPWTQRGPLHPATHPILVEMVAAFSGDYEGRLDDATPLPPLVADVKLKLRNEGLQPERTARRHACPKGSTASHLLHRMRLLRVPGFNLEQVQEEDESWKIVADPTYESALIEAGAWGPTLEQAVRAKLEERLIDCEGHLDKVAEILRDSYQAGLKELSAGLLQAVADQVSAEVQFGRLGLAAGTLLGLWRDHPRPRMGQILETLVTRGLWLYESLCGSSGPADKLTVHGVVALRDIFKHGNELELCLIDAQAVMRRKGEDLDAPPAVRGAALGFLWSTEGSQKEQTLRTLYRSSLPEELGDFLAGLFGVAREEVVHEKGLVQAIDGVVCGYSQEDFMIAIPSLRMAFSYFPPRERERVGRTVAVLHGLSEEESHTLMRLDNSPELIASNHKLDARVTELMVRYGLTEVPS